MKALIGLLLVFISARAFALDTLSAGFDHNAAIVNGAVWLWGGNTGGKLGNGTTANSAIPVKAVGLSNMVQVATGMSFTLAVKNDGTVWAWGLNDYGQLGYATSTFCTVPNQGPPKPCSTVPQQVPGLTGIIQVGAGWGHSIALQNDGTVWSWGDNGSGPGQLGRPCPTFCATPGQVQGLPGPNPVLQIAVGYFHTVAMFFSGIPSAGNSLVAWGRGHDGELGNGGTSSSSAPVSVALGNVTRISSRGAHTLALQSKTVVGVGTVVSVWAWGWNRYGQIGDNDTVDDPPADRLAPYQLPIAINSPGAKIAAGFGFSVVVDPGGYAWSWGLDNRGQLGGDFPSPGFCTRYTCPLDHCGGNADRVCARVPLNGGLHTLTDVVAGGAHTLGIRADGSLTAVGDNQNGQLGFYDPTGPHAFFSTTYDPDLFMTPTGTYGSGGSVGQASSDTLNLQSLDQGVPFAGIPVGSSAPVALSLTNLTADPIQITGIGVSGEYSSTNDCGSALAGNGHCAINVTFSPMGGGKRPGTLTVQSDLLDSPTLTLDLDGIGLSVPAAPVIGAAAAGNASAMVAFAPSGDDGGSPITSYTATANPGGASAPAGASPIVVAGLANGTPYTFTVRANNAIGASAPSSASNGVTPMPANPYLLTVVPAGAGTGSVTSSPAGIDCGASCSASFDPGTPVTLQANASPSSQFAAWSGACSGTGTCQVTMNSAMSVTAAFNGVPDPPGDLAATPGDSQATFTFSAPANDGGKPVLSYTVTCTPGPLAITRTGPPMTLAGLTNDTLYACSATATNGVGASVASFPVNTAPADPGLPALLYVQSRKPQGTAGTYDLAIDPSQSIGGPVTVEPRNIGGGHAIVFQFNAPITFVGPVTALDAGNNPVGSVATSFSGNEAIVTLTGVPDAKRLTISLSNVNGVGVNASASMGFLVGDVNKSRSVSAADILAVKFRSGSPTDTTNFQCDLNLNGSISAADILATKFRSGTALP